MILNIVILALVTLQRLGELWLSNRNTRGCLAKGAREHRAGHYPLIVARPRGVARRAVVARAGHGRSTASGWRCSSLLELARIWVLASLGPRWTTRIIVLPDAPLVRRGPYRLVNHPNYLVVVGEIAVLPLVFGLWQVALIFTLLNAAILAIRIRAENAALRPLSFACGLAVPEPISRLSPRHRSDA